jgi:hypothetical protein
MYPAKICITMENRRIDMGWEQPTGSVTAVEIKYAGRIGIQREIFSPLSNIQK